MYFRLYFILLRAGCDEMEWNPFESLINAFFNSFQHQS